VFLQKKSTEWAQAMSFAAVEHAAKGLCITAGLVTFRVTSLICLGSVCKLTPGLFIAK